MALTSTRAGKTQAIADVKDKFSRMTSVVFVDYKGMTVETATELRVKLAQAGVDYKVVKNTIVKQAIKGQDFAGKLDDVLTGMTGVAWCYEDPSIAAKVVKAFRKDKGEVGEKQLQIKAGLIDGQVLDGKAVVDHLATMPGKDELRSSLLATLQAPLQQFVMLLNAPAQNFAYLLSSREDDLKKKGA
jgi:large subunit ribosomal protein L10